MTERGTKLVVAAVATALVALVVAIGAVAVALTAVQSGDRNERTTSLVEQRLLVLCRREVVVGGRITARGLTLETAHGC
jgi:hypothetical protein